MCVHNSPTALETVQTAGWLVCGITFIVSAFIPWWGVSLVIPPYLTWAEAVIGTLLTVGSLLGLQAARPRQHISQQWMLDEVGMWLAAGGWGVYAVCSGVYGHMALTHILISLLQVILACVRIGAIRKHRAYTEAAIARMKD